MFLGANAKVKGLLIRNDCLPEIMNPVVMLPYENVRACFNYLLFSSKTLVGVHGFRSLRSASHFPNRANDFPKGSLYYGQ